MLQLQCIIFTISNCKSELAIDLQMSENILTQIWRLVFDTHPCHHQQLRHSKRHRSRLEAPLDQRLSHRRREQMHRSGQQNEYAERTAVPGVERQHTQENAPTRLPATSVVRAGRHAAPRRRLESSEQIAFYVSPEARFFSVAVLARSATASHPASADSTSLTRPPRVS